MEVDMGLYEELLEASKDPAQIAFENISLHNDSKETDYEEWKKALKTHKTEQARMMREVFTIATK